MENSIFTGLSRQMVLQTQMDLIANNIANASTPGYRAQNMLFKEYIAKPSAANARENPSDPLSMVEDYGQYRSLEEGPMQRTGNQLDVAIHGNGWFGVQTANGLRYTRDGAFTLNTQGQLVTSSGDLVASAGGGTITIPDTARDITITPNGTVNTDQGTAGQLMLVSFQNPQHLKPEGDNLYSSDETGIPSLTSQVHQGMLEGSNVKPIMEMTQMIQVSRAYQATQQMMMDEHNRIRGMIQDLTQNS